MSSQSQGKPYKAFSSCCITVPYNRQTYNLNTRTSCHFPNTSSLSWFLNFPSSRSLCMKCPFHIPKSAYFSKSPSNPWNPHLKRCAIFWIQSSCFPYLLVFTNGMIKIMASFDAYMIWSSTDLCSSTGLFFFFAAILCNFLWCCWASFVCNFQWEIVFHSKIRNRNHSFRESLSKSQHFGV